MTKTIVVSVQVLTECPVQGAKAAEMLNRVAMGLALDGITTRQDMTSFQQEEENDEEEADQGPGDSTEGTGEEE